MTHSSTWIRDLEPRECELQTRTHSSPHRTSQPPQWEEAIQHINRSSHLSRAGQALVHPKPNVKAFEEVGLDEGGEPILAPDLLVRIEAEMDSALQRSPIQGGQCREVLNTSTPFIFLLSLCSSLLVIAICPPIHHVSLIKGHKSQE